MVRVEWHFLQLHPPWHKWLPQAPTNQLGLAVASYVFCFNSSSFSGVFALRNAPDFGSTCIFLQVKLGEADGLRLAARVHCAVATNFPGHYPFSPTEHPITDFRHWLSCDLSHRTTA